MEFDERIRDAEAQLQKRILHDPAAEAVRLYDTAVAAFNVWVEAEGAKLKADRKRVVEIEASVKKLDEHIVESDAAWTKARPEDSIEVRNAMIEQRNAIVRERNARADDLSAAIERHNGLVGEHNNEQKRGADHLDQLLAQARKEIRDRHEWECKDGALSLACEVNELFRDVSLAAGACPHRMAPFLEATRNMRRTLGEWAQRQQADSQQGILIASASLGSAVLTSTKEPVYLCVDIASSVTAISPMLVQALGLEPMMGDEVSLRLVNGIKLQARSIILPSICVNEVEANLVEGVVLQNDLAGVDGILGLSFLSRFDFRIESHRPQRLTLNPRKRGGFRYDVFITHKTADLEYARQINDWLLSQGCAVFFIGEPSGDVAGVNVQNEIDEALRTSAHLIVVASAPEHVVGGWVEKEWREFEILCMDDPKRKRHTIPVLCGGIQAERLPLALRGFGAIRFDSPGWQPKLLRIVQQAP